jgi:hypothetical protein
VLFFFFACHPQQPLWTLLGIIPMQSVLPPYFPQVELNGKNQDKQDWALVAHTLEICIPRPA